MVELAGSLAWPRLPFPRIDKFVAVTAGGVVVFTAYVANAMGAEVGLGLLFVCALFLTSILAFLLVPHVAVALMIPLFALIPAAKVLLNPTVGPLKDVVSLAAIVAAVAVLALGRRAGSSRPRPDRWILLAVALLLGLYTVNLGGGHGVAWAQGTRLMAEPLLLLVAGFTLADPRRTLRWAIPALVATACFAAAYGLLQQVVGPWTLVGWGYSFSEQVRSYNGHLRSFGTFDDPFAYAAFLCFGLAAVVFGMRRRPLAWTCGILICAGLAVSWVRTALLITIALFGLWVARKGAVASAALLIAAATIAMGSIVATGARASETRTYQSTGWNLTLNGRTSAWKTALGPPGEWPFGRGVGKVGTAAARATYALVPGRANRPPTRAVDSGYLATIADVGLIGAAVLLALLGRLIGLGASGIRRGASSGWLATALLAVLVLDALTRSSFTGFPTAFLGFLLLGLALSAAAQANRLRRPPRARQRRVGSAAERLH